MTTPKVMLSTCLFAAAAAPMAWAQPGGDYTGPHPMWGGGWMFMGPLTMLLFLAAIIAVVVFIFRRAGGRRKNAGRPRKRPWTFLISATRGARSTPRNSRKNGAPLPSDGGPLVCRFHTALARANTRT